MLGDWREKFDALEKEVGEAIPGLARVLLATDGSITRILEAYTQGPVKIVTIDGAEIQANADLAKELNIQVGSKVTHRVVKIVDVEGEALIFAESFIPLFRLPDTVKKDLTHADIPIGKILAKHNLETRRELRKIWVEPANKKITQIFKVKPNHLFLCRTYDIIYKNKILMKITEKFPHDLFSA